MRVIPSTFMFSIATSFQLSFGRRRLLLTLQASSTSSSGDALTTTCIHNTTFVTDIPLDQREERFPCRSSSSCSEPIPSLQPRLITPLTITNGQIIEESQVQWDLTELDLNWNTLEQRQILPPVVEFYASEGPGHNYRRTYGEPTQQEEAELEEIDRHQAELDQVWQRVAEEAIQDFECEEAQRNPDPELTYPESIHRTRIPSPASTQAQPQVKKGIFFTNKHANWNRSFRSLSRPGIVNQNITLTQ